MAILVVLEWSAPEANVAGTLAALEAVQAHLSAEHPQIRTARVMRRVVGEQPSDAQPSGAQPADAQPHVVFRWEEGHESMAAFEALTMTDECDTVWLRVWELAVPGTHQQTVWDDGGVPRGPAC